MGRERELNLLREARIELVLVDVGASIEPFELFRPLLPVAVYLGFDPDLREMHDKRDAEFHRHIVINKAVVSTRGAQSVFFCFDETSGVLEHSSSEPRRSQELPLGAPVRRGR